MKSKPLKSQQSKFKSELEAKTAKQLNDDCVTYIYEGFRLNYTKPETDHYYKADFPVKKSAALLSELEKIDLLPEDYRYLDYVFLECKGGPNPRQHNPGLDVATRKKMLLVKDQHPGIDIRFVFENPDLKLRKGSKRTYASWAEEHGFKWCGPKIPKEWFKDMN